MKKNIKKAKAIRRNFKLALALLVTGGVIVGVKPKTVETTFDDTTLYYEKTSYQMQDIANAKLYYTSDNNYIEVTTLDENTMNENEYTLEVVLENEEILRYSVEEINYENDDFVIEAVYVGSNEVKDEISLDFASINMDSSISLMSNIEDVAVINNNGEVSVSNYEEFISAITSDLNANVVLANDIDFSGYVASTYIISGTFTGTIEGNNNAILNLSNTLFEQTNGANISNVLIKDAFVSGAVRSIFVATMEDTKIDNVHITDSVLRATANNGIGPFAGTVTSSTLSNISVTDTILGGSRFLGGLFGLSYGATYVDNAYVATDIRHYETYAAGVVTLGYSESSINISNSIIDVSLSTSDALYKGGIYGAGASGDLNGVLVNLTTDVDRINKIGETLLSSGSVTASGTGVYTVKESGGTSSGFDFEKEVSKLDLDKDFYTDLGLESSYWDLDKLNEGIPTLKSYTSVVEAYKENENPESSFIDVSNAEEFIEAISNDNSANINVTDDLNFLLYDTSTAAIITDTYSGILKGNGYAVLNLSIALFNSVDGAEIYDLLICDANISGRVGIFAGTVLNSTIQSLHIKDSYVYSSNDTSGVGALAGAITSSIIDDVSITNTTVQASKRSGGIAGYGYGTIFLSNIYIDTDTLITNDSDATGGLIGQNSAYIYMEDALIAPVFNSNGSSNRGGLVGYSTGILQFVDVVVAAISTSSDSIANNIPILHGYCSSMAGNMYEWEGSNLKKQYNYTYTSLLLDKDVNYDFFANTLYFDEEVWDVSANASSSNWPIPKSLQEMINRYEDSLPEITSTLKTVSEYDALIKQKYTVAANQVLTEEVEYLLLLRNLVNNVGYDHLVAYIRAGELQQEFVEWLIQYENIKMYTEAGEPDGGSYTNSMRVLYEIYANHKDDLDDHRDTGKGVTFSEIYKKMMFTISHTHSTIVGLWVSKSNTDYNEPNNSTGLGRYEIYRRMVIADTEVDEYAPESSYKTSILDDIFYELEMEEMRYVMNGIIDDESIEWLEWYVRTKKLDARGGYSLVSYISGYDYTLEKYYTDEEYWDNKYGFSQYGMTYSQLYPKQWSVFEEGGVCGAISKTATNAQTVNGRPGTVVSQPGHAAYVYFNQATNGDFYWGTVQTSLATWAYTGKTEKLWTRMPCGWGNDSVVTGYAASYLFISQAALNRYDEYVESEMELLLAQVYAGDNDKLETIYWNTLDKLEINLDAWLALARLYVADSSKTDDDKYDLLEKMAEALTYQPLPLYHTSNIVISTISDNTVTLKISNLLEETFTNATKATGNESLEATGLIGVAQYLLGAVNTTVATFSFDGENSGQVVLDSQFEGAENVWFVSVDCGTTWIEAEGMSLQLTDEQIEAINDEDDVRMCFSGVDRDNPENHYIMDITVATTPIFSANLTTSNLYANDLENRVIGGSTMDINTIQWYDEITRTWKWIEEERPNLSGDTTVTVRVGPTGTQMASGSATASFTTNTDLDTRKYVSIDRLSIKESSSLYSSSYDYLAIDGSMNTMFHSAAQTDNFITIEVDEPIYMTGFEYTPRTSNTNGIVYTGEIYTSLDNENWTLAREVSWASNNLTKTETFEEEIYAKYVKLVAKTSGGNFLCAAMINLFEDTTNQESIELEYSNLEPTNQDVTVILTGDEVTITNNNGKNEYTFTENGEFTFEYTNSIGTAKTITATVENIDKEAPTADVEYTLDTENGLVIASLIHESEEFIVTNNLDSEDSIVYEFKENGDFIFEIEDLVGNKNEIQAIVGNISFAYIKIDGKTFGDGETYSKEKPYELPSVEYTPVNISRLYSSDISEDKVELLTNDIEVYYNDDLVDLDIVIQLLESSETTEEYLLKVTNELGFTTYFSRTMNFVDIKEEEVDKNELQTKIEEANNIDTTIYTEETVFDLSSAISEAKKVLENEEATSEDVEKAIETLNEAIENLKEKSSNAKLSKLEITGYTISPNFDEDVLKYSVDVADINSFEEIIVEVQDVNAKYKVIGNNNFIEGENTIVITVEAQDGTIKEYTIIVDKEIYIEEEQEEVDKKELETKIDEANNIDTTMYTEETVLDLSSAISEAKKVLENEEATSEDVEKAIETLNEAIENLKEKSSNAKLSKLEITGYTISPNFDEDVLEYSVEVVDIDSFEEIIVEVQDINAEYTVSGNDNFIEGENTIVITVMAQDETIKEYTIIVDKEIYIEEEQEEQEEEEEQEGEEEQEEEVDKKELETKIDEANSIDTTIYTGETVVVLNSAISEAKKVLENEEATSEEVEKAIETLNEAIESLKEKSSNAKLSKLEITGYTISPNFDEDVLEYRVNVADIDSFEEITVEVQDTNAIYIVKGNNNFVEGENTIVITVMAQDGTIKEYTIVVDKEEYIEEENEEDNLEQEDLDDIYPFPLPDTGRSVLIVLFIAVFGILAVASFRKFKNRK